MKAYPQDLRKYSAVIAVHKKYYVECSSLKMVVTDICPSGKYYVGTDNNSCGWEGIGCWIIEDNFIVS